jgi:ribosomal-protein-alanine N-acetyltransferase
MPSAADYDAVASWIPDASACRRWAGPTIPFPFAASELAALLAVPGGASYCLAVGDHAALGFGQYWPRPAGSVHLLRIIVAPDARGNGLGRVLCSQLLEQALAATSAGSITLNVYRDNPAALALYESLGFAVVIEKSSGDALFMRKPGRGASLGGGGASAR